MSIKIKVLNEQEQKVASDVKAADKALNTNQTIQRAFQKINTRAEFEQVVSILIDAVSGNLKEADVALGLKNAYQSKRKELSESQINEMVEFLTPEILAAVAGGLGVSIGAIKSMLSKPPQADDKFNSILDKEITTDKNLKKLRKTVAKKEKAALKAKKAAEKAQASKRKDAMDRLAKMKADRGLNEEVLSESVVADVVNFVVQNPMLSALGAAGIATFVSKLKGAMAPKPELNAVDEVNMILKTVGLPELDNEKWRMEKELRDKLNQRKLQLAKDEREKSSIASSDADKMLSEQFKRFL